MKIIVSPAKKMRAADDWMAAETAPVYINEAEMLSKKLKSCTEPELKAIFKANDSITHENFIRYRDMQRAGGPTPALLAYVGIQYQYMAPQVFSAAQWEYVCRNLRILSGFYGILRPSDGIMPYRLEMQAKFGAAAPVSDLYSFWGDKIYRELVREDKEILNLASKEYSRAVEKYLEPEVRFVTCVFAERDAKTGKLKTKATEAKMARGEMVRYLAETGGSGPEAAKGFDRLGFSYEESLSDPANYVFVKK